MRVGIDAGRGARAVARVDALAVGRNCEALRSRLQPGTELCAVVKADGYGHGAIEAAEAARRVGASWLAVVTAAEAAELRGRGDHGRLLVMGPLAIDEIEAAIGGGLDVVAWTPQFLDAIATLASPDAPVRVHVEYDTGMGRTGAKEPELVRMLCRRAASDPRLELVGLMTHFATADEIGDGFFGTQLTRFAGLAATLKQQHPGLIAHAANTAATLRDAAAHFDLVRCGIGIYGMDPFHEDALGHGLSPALSLHSYVASVKAFAAGDSAGYGRRWSAPTGTQVAVVPVGYGDGWRRDLTNRADVLIRGRRHPAVGTVSMDSMTIDLGPVTDVTTGDAVVLIGSQAGERITAEEVAGRLGTISYDVTCGLTKRVPRVHFGSNAGLPARWS